MLGIGGAKHNAAGLIVILLFLLAGIGLATRATTNRHAAPQSDSQPSSERRGPADSRVSVGFGSIAKSYQRNGTITFWVQNRSSQTLWVESSPGTIYERGGAWADSGDSAKSELVVPHGVVEMKPFTTRRFKWNLRANFDGFWATSPRFCQVQVAVIPGAKYDPTPNDARWFFVYSSVIKVNFKR